jgi:hypothetical protein
MGALREGRSAAIADPAAMLARRVEARRMLFIERGPKV